MVDRLVSALNAHDPQRMAALFAPDYRSVQPVHPARGFGGREQVQANWTAVFAGVPDFTAELVGSCADGASEWGEWDWHGRHTDGSAFAMRGVTILTVRDGLIRDMRLYLEPVDTSGGDIDVAVQELYRPPPG
ncbi:nuclear transport factor 2 family protein [Nakamurella sp.]|uniref:nuclear transport factor 2 family protein n=1 Tax=Nakamurella sp. TaxID=1869182 RepID=UPI0037831B1A